MIDYTFRFDPSRRNSDPQPATSEEARQTLIKGNRIFADWMKSCRCGGHDRDEQFVVACGGLESVLSVNPEEFPTQKPFAVVVGCSDARVPTEMLFGQGFNDLFVVRNAGNVLSDVVQGSIDFTLNALKDSVRVIVVLGHTNCGAVKGAVDAYLNPARFWSESYSPNLRLIFQRIFVAVRESDNIIREVWGADAPKQPGYQDALVEAAVCLNAAHTAFAIRQQMAGRGTKTDVQVLFGAYDVRTHEVCMPTRPIGASRDDIVNLALAPDDPGDLAAIARQVATNLKPGADKAVAGRLAPA